MVIYGTRPEAVKVAPLIQALQASPLFTPVVAVTAQHRSMLDQVNEVFGIMPDFDLDIHQPGQTLTSITTRALAGVQQLPELIGAAGSRDRYSHSYDGDLSHLSSCCFRRAHRRSSAG